MTVSKHELPFKTKKELVASINDFKGWLHRSKGLRLDAAARYSKVTFPRPSSADWIMRVVGQDAQFNTHMISKCSFDFFRFVVLHECFHLFVQDVPNKSDAKRLKDDFGEIIMKLLDVEADYYTAIYYKEVKKATLVDIFTIFYEGSTIFGDPRIRAPKVERFIGTVLSVANAFFKNPGKDPVKETDLYLPTINNIPTEDSIHTLISTKNHFLVGEIQANLQAFQEIKKCYVQANTIGLRKYVDTLLRFAGQALRQEIPLWMCSEVHCLEDHPQFQ